MSMSSGFYAEHLPGLVRSGQIPEPVLDRSVRRVLELKRRLGLLDHPFGRLSGQAVDPTDAPRHRPLAREAARRSIVLLKNDGVLPLPKGGRTIALLGPFARGPENLNGPWVLFGHPEEAVSLEQGVRAALEPDATLLVASGCAPEEPISGGIAEALAAARQADLILLAVGEAENMSGEAQSRTEIDIPAPQRALVEAIIELGKPVVTIVRNGRALVLGAAVAQSNAILIGWFLGSETGTALADILFGDHGPSGRLPISFPQAVGQSPFFYDRRATGRPPNSLQPDEPFKSRYREGLNVAAYPFGHGLTYGEIAYEELDLGSAELPWSGALEVHATVSNRGKREATELVQLYVRDRVASITRPIRQLKAFQHVTLAPGASERVSFTIKREDLLFVGPDLKWTVEPGQFDLWIAPSAVTGLHGTFELLPA
jgi:beta-glucosidase